MQPPVSRVTQRNGRCAHGCVVVEESGASSMRWSEIRRELRDMLLLSSPVSARRLFFAAATFWEVVENSVSSFFFFPSPDGSKFVDNMTLLSMLITSPLTICCSLLFLPFTVVKGDCLSDSTLNDFFLDPDDPNDALPREGSCCQSDICGLACPEVLDDPVAGYGIAVGIAIGLSFAIGVW